MSKGELSPLLEGSPDLEAYFEGAKTLENWHILRQGGITRWPGSRHVAFAKYADRDTILLPFEASVDDAYMLEVGDFYIRVYKNKAQVLDAGVPVEIVTPFAVADIRSIHYTQSADVLFLFHNSYQQRLLSRVSDTEWSLTAQQGNPPPSFEADTTLPDTIALGANTGEGIEFRVGSAGLLAGDEGRQIIIGAGRAVITTYTNTSSGVCDILDDFNQGISAGPNTITTVGTAATSTAHGLADGDYVVLTSGAQSGQVRICSVVLTADTFTLDAAFGANQAGTNWNRIAPTTSGNWGLRLSPQTTLDPNKASPVGVQVTCVAGAAAFRTTDVGKFITVYGGVIEITSRTSSTTVKGTLLSVMGAADLANPSAAAAGTWTLEVPSWSASTGWPRTGDFYQGRLYQASTPTEPTTFWGSRSDDYDNYAIGLFADDAVKYTMAARQLNRIEWVREHNRSLMIGTSGSEHAATGSGNDNVPLGGDIIPYIDRLATNGCMGTQPVSARKTTIYVDRSRRKIMGMGFDLNSDSEADTELSVGAEHITTSGIRLGPIGYEKRLNPRLYFVREDGQLVAMTFFPEQKVVAFSRRTTDGTIEAVGVIPGATGESDHVWVIAIRVINGIAQRCVEVFDEHHPTLLDRAWMSLQTDGAVVVTGVTGTSVTGLTQFSGRSVDVIKNGSFIGQHAVSLGGSYSLTLVDALVATDVLEIGFHYDSPAVTMRPAVPGGETVEGLPRSWDSIFLRVHDTIGGKVNGEPLLYPADPLSTNVPYTGDVKATGQGWDTEGRITIVQDQPYPITVLATFGTLSFGDKD
jgi:hypothetical protein